jgi:hypothetical protein
LSDILSYKNDFPQCGNAWILNAVKLMNFSSQL